VHQVSCGCLGPIFTFIPLVGVWFSCATCRRSVSVVMLLSQLRLLLFDWSCELIRYYSVALSVNEKQTEALQPTIDRMSWPGRLVAGFLPRSLRFIPNELHVRCEMDQIRWEQITLWDVRFSCANHCSSSAPHLSVNVPWVVRYPWRIDVLLYPWSADCRLCLSLGTWLVTEWGSQVQETVDV